MWLVQYRAASGYPLTTTHNSRQDAFEMLADQLFQIALHLWELGGDTNERTGDILMRHAVRLTAEAEQPGTDGYLLRLSQGRRWVVTPV